MNDFTSVIQIDYKDGKGTTVLSAMKDGQTFTRMYDPSDEKAEKEATSGLAKFLGGQVSEDGKAIEVEVGEKAEAAKEPEVDLSEVKPFKMDQAETETASGDPVYHIRPTDEIEELLNRAGNTAGDMDDYIVKGIFSGRREDMEKLAGIGTGFAKSALEFMGKEVPTDPGTIAACQSIYGVHLTNLIDRLCWALDNTLGRYEKAKYRLYAWGDVKYVADLEEGKI